MALVLSALLGCASQPPDALERHRQGWKAGVVQAIGPAEQFGADVPRDCPTDEGASAQTFARVRYPHLRTWRTVIAPVPEGESLKNGQEVWVSNRACLPIAPR